MTNLILILLALVLANLPWFSEQLFYIFPFKTKRKSFFWCLIELLMVYLMFGLVARYAEFMTIGQVMPQRWEFFAITFCLFVVLSSPGFIIRYLWKN